MSVPVTGARRPVAAVTTDGPEAAAVARRAARIATEEERPVLLPVPMLRSAFTADAVIARRVHDQALREARAVAARAVPALGAAEVAFRVQVVRHRNCSPCRARQARAIAPAHAAHRVGAPVVTTPARDGGPVPSAPLRPVSLARRSGVMG